jgi:hypothetical protein
MDERLSFKVNAFVLFVRFVVDGLAMCPTVPPQAGPLANPLCDQR